MDGVVKFWQHVMPTANAVPLRAALPCTGHVNANELFLVYKACEGYIVITVH